MKSIFIVYMAPGNAEQMVHYQDTIKNRVTQDRILKYLPFNMKNTLRELFGSRPIAVWGSRNTSANRSRFEKMQPSDDILIVEGKKIRLLGKIAAKVISPELSRELWKNIRGETTDGWDLIYFIGNAIEIDLPFGDFNALFGYEDTYRPQGFTSVSDEKVREFYQRYDDLYSVLLKVKRHERPETKPLVVKEPSPLYQPESPSIELVEDILSSEELSDHVRMQWKLVQLGLKTGSTVWVPKGDQKKIQKEFDYGDFPTEFAAGIDMPARYVENIDVVWKEEFRVDAAFEIENSTAIYSGLLRFADLKIVAPNSNYPLFLVAPLERKNRVWEQLKRPAFQKLSLTQKVSYLSYEALEDIDKFFAQSASGLNVEILQAKSEQLNEQ